MHRDMNRELQAQKAETQRERDEWVRIFFREAVSGSARGYNGRTLPQSSRKYKGKPSGDR